MTRPNFKSSYLALAAGLALAGAGHSHAQVTDPGFENYTVAPAGFTQATSDVGGGDHAGL